jgi:hypothetical protein
MLSLARELKTPLYGEVTKLGERIQKAFLFREGIYDPPPEDWPTFIKLNTGLALLHLERWTCYNAPLWYYKIMEVIDNQLPGQVVGYIWDEPSFDRAIFSPLFDFCQAYEKEEHGPLKQMIYPLYMTSCRSQTSEALGMFRVYEALSWLWDVGALTQSEYHTLTNDVLEVARSLLYMPTKASVENELSYIGKQLSRLMELAITSKAESDDSPYIPVSDWSDDLVPQYWLR